MTNPRSSIHWLRALGAAVAVLAWSFLILIGVVTIYAFALAVQARGAPDQAAINHFAASISPKVLPWLEMGLTVAMAFIAARRDGKTGIIHGFLLGVFVGLLGLVMRLLFGGRPGLRDVVFLLSVVGLGCFGSVVGQQRTGNASGHRQTNH